MFQSLVCHCLDSASDKVSVSLQNGLLCIVRAHSVTASAIELLLLIQLSSSSTTTTTIDTVTTNTFTDMLLALLFLYGH